VVLDGALKLCNYTLPIMTTCIKKSKFEPGKQNNPRLCQLKQSKRKISILTNHNTESSSLPRYDTNP